MDLSQIQVLLSGSSPIGWILALGMLAYQIYVRSRKPAPSTPTPAPLVPGPDGTPIVPAGCTTADLFAALQAVLSIILQRRAKGQMTPDEVKMIESVVDLSKVKSS